MRIGAFQLTNNLLLAPMAGVTDLPFRQLCRRFGASLAVSEMVSSKVELRRSRKSERRLERSGETGPISIQILGTDPNGMAEAARYHADRGAHIIDINMGCPAKKVCKTSAGSALLRNEPLVAEILETVVARVEVPITLKMRTGWHPGERNGVRIAQIAEAAGVSALAVHGRTRACGYGNPAEYDTIKAIKRAVTIPVIANGDIDTPEKASEIIAYTGADAVMIGRAALGRPWLFSEAGRFLATGLRPPPPSPGRIKIVLLEHLDALYRFYGEHDGVKIARKHIHWYCRTQPGYEAFRARVNRVTSARDQQRQVTAFFNDRPTGEKMAA